MREWVKALMLVFLVAIAALVGYLLGDRRNHPELDNLRQQVDTLRAELETLQKEHDAQNRLFPEERLKTEQALQELQKALAPSSAEIKKLQGTWSADGVTDRGEPITMTFTINVFWDSKGEMTSAYVWKQGRCGNTEYGLTPSTVQFEQRPDKSVLRCFGWLIDYHLKDDSLAIKILEGDWKGQYTLKRKKPKGF
jgi:hypothetical protein